MSLLFRVSRAFAAAGVVVVVVVADIVGGRKFFCLYNSIPSLDNGRRGACGEGR